MDGTGGQQQLGDRSGLSGPVARAGHPGPLQVSWDNGPAHRGEALRACRRTPGLELGLVNLPGYNPDCNAVAAIWVWAGQEATGNQRLGTQGSQTLVRERVSGFRAGLAGRKDEDAVKRRCRTVLQSRAEALRPEPSPNSKPASNAHPTLASV